MSVSGVRKFAPGARKFGFGDAEGLGALRITDARLREQARKSTIGCVLNIAEGAVRRSRADKSRVYAIALGEGTRATLTIGLIALCAFV